MIHKALNVLFALSISITGYSQNSASIIGVIKGLGTGKKIILGNKPKGINPSFVYVKYDSTLSSNDSFYFNKVKFESPGYYSLEFEGAKGWKPFFIDKGLIKVDGTIESVYTSKLEGSKNDELIKEYYNSLYANWDAAHQKILKRFNAENDSIKKRKILDTVLSSMSDYRNRTIAFYDMNVKEYPYAAFYLLRNINLNNYPDSFVKEQFLMLPKEAQMSTPLEDIYYRLTYQKQNVEIGKKIPNFLFKGKQSLNKDLYGIDYKYKLLVFGASWCAPCIEEIPALDSLNRLYEKKGLGILAISVDNTEEKWKIYASNFKTKIVQLFTGSPSKSRIYKYFNINAIPYIILLDSKNAIIKNNIKLEELEKIIH